MGCGMAITEAEFTDQVLQYASRGGWRTAHFRAARTAGGWRTAVQGDGKGFPDLVLVKDKWLLFVELKRSRHLRVTSEQWGWLQALAQVPGVMSRLWTPDDWPEIERVLGGLRVA